MHRKIFSLMMASVLLLSFTLVKQAFSYRIPPKDSNIKYLYVFGEDGKKSYGAKKEPQVVFLRIPENYKGNVEISIYDPDIGGSIDEKSGKWNTASRFSIFGGAKAYTSVASLSEASIKDFKEGVLLDSKDFTEDAAYDEKYYHFSPISADKGEKVGNFLFFKIVAEGLYGNDNNVFAIEVSPDSAEAFSYALSLRLSETRGAKMALYPEIPKNASSIIEYNYDADATGAAIELVSMSKSYGIKASGTGVWANTKIAVLPGDTGKRWVYEITKKTQPNANMAMYMTTSDGLAIPVFFMPGVDGPKMVFVEEPKVVAKSKVIEEKPWMGSKLSCNTFTFDGSKSSDPDNQAISYFWDFGDGTTSTQLKAMHTFKDAGKYLIKLTVTDSSDVDCNTATTQQVVHVNQPPCAIADGPSITCVNNEIMFDGKQSTDSPEDKLTYRWNFGDGETAEGVNVKHKYAEGGDYQVTLTVLDDSGTMCDTGMDKLKVLVNTAPVADAGKDTILCKRDSNDPLEVTFDSSKTKDADGDNLTYVWDFGDGNTGEGTVVTHRYAKGGEYTAKLLVSDNSNTDCSKSTATKLVKLNRSPETNAGDDMKICLTDKADFDASSSIDNDGDELSYKWDFGDGKSVKGKNASHKYAKGGLYKATLTVDDGTGTECASVSDEILVDVNSIPSADISADDITCVSKIIKFDGSGSNDLDGDKLTYTWDFGDGNTASGATAKHGYVKGGSYKATLFIDDGRNSDCSGSTKIHSVNVNTPPVANAGPDLLICVTEEVELDATGSFDPDNNNITYTWDFGDGETATGPKVRHAYKGIGVYKISLTVKDDSGTECDVATDTLVATVNAKPIPVIEVI